MTEPGRWGSPCPGPPGALSIPGFGALSLSEGLYDVMGTDLHSELYADFFDRFGFHIQ